CLSLPPFFFLFVLFLSSKLWANFLYYFFFHFLSGDFIEPATATNGSSLQTQAVTEERRGEERRGEERRGGKAEYHSCIERAKKGQIVEKKVMKKNEMNDMVAVY